MSREHTKNVRKPSQEKLLLFSLWPTLTYFCISFQFWVRFSLSPPPNRRPSHNNRPKAVRKSDEVALSSNIGCVLIFQSEKHLFLCLRDTNRTWNTTYSDQCHSKQFHIRPLFIVRNMFLPNPSIATAMPYSRIDQESHYFPVWRTIKTCFVHISLFIRTISYIYFDLFFSVSLPRWQKTRK